MKYYGYKIEKEDFDKRVDESQKEWVEDFLKECRHNRYSYITTETFKFLNHLSDGNIDMYKELLKGSYSVFKDDEYKIEREENNIYASDIEILERNIPIVLGLYKFYDCNTIRDIFEYCIDKKQNKINYTKLNRIRRFVQIEAQRKKNRLDFPILKFVKLTKDWVKNHPITNEMEINKYLADYSVGYANSVKNLVVDDNEYLENIFELTKDLWKVVVLQGKSVKGKISITPFELLWEKKTDLNDIYGGSDLTKSFFVDELVNDMREEITVEDDELINAPFEITEKKKLEDVVNELPNVIHKPYGYYEYSEMDKSNERFMRKQENTNSLRETIFIDHNESDGKDIIENEPDLFTNQNVF